MALFIYSSDWSEIFSINKFLFNLGSGACKIHFAYNRHKIKRLFTIKTRFHKKN